MIDQKIILSTGVTFILVYLGAMFFLHDGNILASLTSASFMTLIFRLMDRKGADSTK